MLNGINLTLLIGPAVPVPAPQAVMDALTSIQVNSGGERSGFQLAFSVSKNSLLLTTLLPVGYFDPMLTRVIIMVTINGLPNVLMDGIVTRQEMSPSSEPGQSKLTITGEDLSVLMGVVELKRPFPALDDTLQMLTVLAPYAIFGIVPMGSMLLIFAYAAVYLLAFLGWGLLISTFVDTQQQAMFISFFFMMIFIMLGGLYTNIDSMPDWAKTVAKFNPA